VSVDAFDAAAADNSPAVILHTGHVDPRPSTAGLCAPHISAARDETTESRPIELYAFSAADRQANSPSLTPFSRSDTELLKRGFLGWLRGERGHCTMARVPTIAEEDAKQPNRERECLV
jgi:hypothetical protein